jgi:hypothetical protein
MLNKDLKRKRTFYMHLCILRYEDTSNRNDQQDTGGNDNIIIVIINHKDNRMRKN